MHHSARGFVHVVIGVVFAFASYALAAGQGSAAEYRRADSIADRFGGKVDRDQCRPVWITPHLFWYVTNPGPGQREYVLVDAELAERRKLFDHDALAGALAEPAGEELDAYDLDLRRLRASDDGQQIWFRFADGGWLWDAESGLQESDECPDEFPEPLEAWRPELRRQGERPSRRSPDGKWEVVERDHNLVLRNRESAEEVEMTTDGAADNAYESRVWWSPDSKRLVAMQTTPGEERRVYLVESSPRDRLQPKLDSYFYHKPGDEIPRRRPRLFDVESNSEIAVDSSLFENPYQIDTIRWRRDSSRFTFFYNQRGHQVVRILSVDANSGAVTPIVNEECETFFDYAHKRFDYYLEDTGELIWMSERDGWNHLYLIDATTGDVKQQITSGDWVVRSVDWVDVANREVWFRAGGMVPDQDPYFVHSCRIKFDGTGFVRLTAGDGTHSVAYSPERHYAIDRYSRVEMPTVTTLRRTGDGSQVCELERADATRLLESGWTPPEPFVAKGRDGKTDIWGVVYRPSSFDATLSYPVIEDIYAGPHGAFVPKRFRVDHSSQALAELGFVVVHIDGMGTSNRSKAFHDVAWKNLGDSGFPDRRLWLEALAAKYPSIDLSRVGIKGHSAGGQSALRALLAHGDFYKVAVSSCGCHDNRMDKIWWNELWMSWPIGPHYAEQSNVTNAHKLQGKLLLIVGELDKNVDPSSTMQVVDALIKADKDFDLLVVPGRGHNTSMPYTTRRTRDFFVRHLQNVEPRRN